jgi:hypothetical protein
LHHASTPQDQQPDHPLQRFPVVWDGSEVRWRYFYARVGLPALLPFSPDTNVDARFWVMALCYATPNTPPAKQSALPAVVHWAWQRLGYTRCTNAALEALDAYECNHIRPKLQSHPNTQQQLTQWRSVCAQAIRRLTVRDQEFIYAGMPLRYWATTVNAEVRLCLEPLLTDGNIQAFMETLHRDVLAQAETWTTLTQQRHRLAVHAHERLRDRWNTMNTEETNSHTSGTQDIAVAARLLRLVV